jgi:hypothetical protein
VASNQAGQCGEAVGAAVGESSASTLQQRR